MFLKLWLARLVVAFFPKPNQKISWIDLIYGHGYCKAMVISDLRQQLTLLDPEFRNENKQKEYMTACFVANMTGFKSSDTKYPDLFDYIEKPSC